MSDDEGLWFYDEKLLWARLHGIFNIIVNLGFSEEEYSAIVRKSFGGQPHLMAAELQYVDLIFEDVGKPSLLEAYRKETVLDEPGLQCFLLNTGIETFDLNLYIYKKP